MAVGRNSEGVSTERLEPRTEKEIDPIECSAVAQQRLHLCPCCSYCE